MMKRHIYIVLSTFILISLFQLFPQANHAKGESYGKSTIWVESYEGTVRVESPGRENYRIVQPRMTLQEEDRILTGENGSLLLGTTRGIYLRLYEGTRMEVIDSDGFSLHLRFLSGSLYVNSEDTRGGGITLDLSYGKRVHMVGKGSFRVDGDLTAGWTLTVREGRARINHERGELTLSSGQTTRINGKSHYVEAPAKRDYTYGRSYPYYYGSYPSYPYYGYYIPFTYFGYYYGRHRRYGGHYRYGYKGSHYYGRRHYYRGGHRSGRHRGGIRGRGQHLRGHRGRGRHH